MNLQTKPSQVETLALNGGWHAWVTTSGVQDPDFSVQSGRMFEFFWIRLDWISFPFQPDPDQDYPNEIKRGRTKNLDVE